VLVWKAPTPPVEVGSFGGRPTRGVTLTAGKTLVAVVDFRRLVALDVETGTRRVRVPDGPAAWSGPPAVTAGNETRILDLDGFLVGHDATGRETARFPVELAAPQGTTTAVDMASGLVPLVLDAEGRAALVRPGLDLVVVGRDGAQTAASGAACEDPVGLIPAGPRRLAVACASGMVWLVGD